MANCTVNFRYILTFYVLKSDPTRLLNHRESTAHVLAGTPSLECYEVIMIDKPFVGRTDTDAHALASEYRWSGRYKSDAARTAAGLGLPDPTDPDNRNLYLINTLTTSEQDCEHA